MSIHIASRRLSAETRAHRYPDAVFLDVTSRGREPWNRFTPFYPHGRIPIPFSPGEYSASVEGIWQGLKVFERTDIAREAFANTTMRGLKRTSRANGSVLGHRMGVHGTTMLTYGDARRWIYLPSYEWVLRNCLQQEIEELLRIASSRDIVLLDFEWVLRNCLQQEIEELLRIASSRDIVLLDFDLNDDPDDLTRPLSHAALAKRRIEDLLGDMDIAMMDPNGQ